MLSNLVFSDDLIIRLLQAKFEQDEKLNAIQDAGLDVQKLRIDLLSIALEAMGLPPEEEHGDLNRDWIWSLYYDTVQDGSYEELQHFLAGVRAGLKERGLEQNIG